MTVSDEVPVVTVEDEQHHLVRPEQPTTSISSVQHQDILHEQLKQMKQEKQYLQQQVQQMNQEKQKIEKEKHELQEKGDRYATKKSYTQITLNTAVITANTNLLLSIYRKHNDDMYIEFFEASVTILILSIVVEVGNASIAAYLSYQTKFRTHGETINFIAFLLSIFGMILNVFVLALTGAGTTSGAADTSGM